MYVLLPSDSNVSLNGFGTKISNSSTDNDQSSAGHQLVNVDHTRTIIHIDLDCFYAQVEMVRNPSLRTKPLGIQQKYLLVTCNYVARSRGVTKLMRVSDALQRCPDLVIVSGEDLTHYREMSYRITELFQHISPLVERLGFDENYIDVARLVAERLQGDNQETDVFGHVYGETSTEPDAMTTPICSCGCHRRLVIGSHIAHEMRQALETQLGLTSCAGVAHNKLLAKLVGTTHKPNDQTTLFPHMAGKLMGSLTKATHIPGIGHSTGKKLSSMGITTLNELIEAPLSLLKDEFGYQTASTMQRLCRGHDQSPVVQSGPPQSISDEDSFKKCSSLQQAQLKMKMLICSLLQRLRKDGRQPHTLRLSVRKYSQVHKWTRESRQCNMPDGILHSLHTDEAAAMSRLLDLCVGLFHKMVDTSKPFHLTLINVCFAKFQSPARAATDISKFFSPKPVTKGSDEAGTNNESFTRTDNNDQLASTIQAYANLATRGIDKACKSLFVCSKDDNSDRLPSGSLHSVTERTPPSSSYHEVDGRVNWSTSGHRCEQSSPTYAGSPSERSQNIDNSERSTNSGDDETDLRVTVKDQLSLTFEKEEHKAAVCTDVSPRKRTSFFAWKSDTGHESWTLNKESRCEESQATCSVESVQDKLLVDDMSCETLVRVGGVASGQIDDAAPAVPPHVDPSVFAELPTEVQQELLNEWRSTNINSKPGVNCAKTSHEITLVDLPGVDYSVFKELPQDVQDDILEQHKHKKRTLSGPSSHTDRTLPAKRPRTIKTPSKKSASKSKNIRDFFAQK